jgi:hypothetical protein
LSELATSSFDFYDGVRILLPGAIVAGIYQAVVRTFALHAPLPTSDTLAALAIVSVAGLSLYFVDLPSRSVLYSAALPHKILESWGTPAVGTVQNVYFVLTDTVMPPAIRSRAQYYNSMFRVGCEMVIMFCLAGNGVITTALLTAGHTNTGNPSSAHAVMTVVCGLFGALAAFALVTAYLKAGDKDRPSETRSGARLERARGRLGKQIPCIDRLLLLAAAIASCLYILTHHRGLLVAAAAIATSVWLFRYLRGTFARVHKTEGPGLAGRLSVEQRRNVDASTSTLTVCFAALVTSIPAAIRLPHGTNLTLGAALGWDVLALVGTTLMLSRGHERKLWGAYYTVGTWLRLNRPEIVSEFDLQQDDSTTPR